MKRRFVAGFVALFAFIAPAVFATAPAQAWGEVTYPGTGYAVNNTIYRDVVYCLGSDGAYWLEVKVDSEFTYDYAGRPVIDPISISVSRIWHNSSGAHTWYYWQANHWNHKVHINQGVGAVPQQIVNTWNPGFIPFVGDPTTTWASGLNWNQSLLSSNPHLYVSIIGRYYREPGATADNEVYSCSVDLGPA